MSPDLLNLFTHAPSRDFASEQESIDYIADIYRNVVLAHVPPSPFRRSAWLSAYVQGDVWLKLESLCPNGSFKVRGAIHAVFELKRKFPDQFIKVCAASAGNHAQGVAFAARQLGCEAHIFVPVTAPLVKRAATERLGAKLYVGGKNLEEATEFALAFAHKEGAHLIHAFNNNDIILGQATCAYEIYTQLKHREIDPKSIDQFCCNIGGGGLIAGCGMVFHSLMPHLQLIGCEQEFYNSALNSMHNNALSPMTPSSRTTIADGIAVGMLGNLTFDRIKKYVNRLVTVTDDQIVQGILALFENERLVVEGAGAASVAHLLAYPDMYKNKRIIACISGGNIDPQLFSRVMARGLHATYRTLRLVLCVADRPGGLKSLLEQVALLGGNVLDLIHDRSYSEVSVGDVDVQLTLETRGKDHQQEMIERLTELGFKPRHFA